MTPFRAHYAMLNLEWGVGLRHKYELTAARELRSIVAYVRRTYATYDEGLLSEVEYFRGSIAEGLH